MASTDSRLMDAFNARVCAGHTDTCWLWTGARTDQGYGIYATSWTPRPRYLAHRLSWELNVGPIPNGLLVCHKCDVRLCVNPSHLFVGTIQDNNHDRDAKGRTLKGEARPDASLTDELVRQIWALKMTGRTGRQIADSLHVTWQSVANVIARVSWRHVTDALPNHPHAIHSNRCIDDATAVALAARYATFKRGGPKMHPDSILTMAREHRVSPMTISRAIRRVTSGGRMIREQESKCPS